MVLNTKSLLSKVQRNTSDRYMTCSVTLKLGCTNNSFSSTSTSLTQIPHRSHSAIVIWQVQLYRVKKMTGHIQGPQACLGLYFWPLQDSINSMVYIINTPERFFVRYFFLLLVDLTCSGTGQDGRKLTLNVVWIPFNTICFEWINSISRLPKHWYQNRSVTWIEWN